MVQGRAQQTLTHDAKADDTKRDGHCHFPAVLEGACSKT
jgi:hypothetical protein